MPYHSVRARISAVYAFALGLVGGGHFMVSPPAVAANPVTEIIAEEVPEGTLALGMGWRWADSPYTGLDYVGSVEHDNKSDLMPFYFYEGRYLFAHGSTAGVHLLDSENFSLDALIAYRFDRLETEWDEFFDGIEDREQSLDGGFRGALKGDWGSVSLAWVTDMQSRHEGDELDLTYRYRWQGEKWSLSPFFSYLHWSDSLANYYYGVTAKESDASGHIPSYQPGSTEFWRAGLNTSYRWSKRMRLFANVSLDKLSDEITDSPIVDEDYLPSAMVGLAYAFGNVIDDAAVRRQRPERVGEWSWRANYGYTAESTFHKVHRGDVRRNDDVHTYLAGATLGKLALDGRRVDVWGKLSVNRRLEKDYQEDFWEINPYIMLMGTGYSPWSNREVFRYGFGYGFSYAEKVPWVEQVKQEKRDKNTSHFLNYLEAQVDFPLRNTFGSRGWWKDCYAGLTIVHRSGIFGRVDILGNVSGGSDVLTGHLECKR
ncbi:MipA/OmpV family protein [Halioglobus maricola]|uniref:MipA/OmpV family protein n=1 Tax=Halioglobus maricola TaxID=2601894 RepID=A0A5P9NLD9_9GAMM|nr:MipA/OmpV family protein [Halioglobus maricola]QFU76597.1 MipA/OmpV family protein [Halioglobus maricola]